MFRCAITGKLSKAGDSQIRIVTKTRPKTYFGPLRDEETGKTVYQRDEEGRVLLDDNGVPVPVMTKVGEGFEIVEEVAVTQEGYEKYLASKELLTSDVKNNTIKKTIVGK